MSQRSEREANSRPGEQLGTKNDGLTLPIPEKVVPLHGRGRGKGLRKRHPSRPPQAPRR